MVPDIRMMRIEVKSNMEVIIFAASRAVSVIISGLAGRVGGNAFGTR